MAVGSGIGAQIGFAPETTYGTYVAPTKWLVATKFDLKKVKNTDLSSGFGAGALMDFDSRRVVTTLGAAGGLSFDLVNRGLGLIVQALMGTTVTPVQQGGTTAYLQTHTLADPTGKMLTIQAGLPDTTGTVRPYSYLGCKVTDATFNYELGKILTAQVGLDARDVTEAQTLGAASVSATLKPFVGTQTSVKVGVFGSEAAVTGVNKASVKIDRKLDTTGRYYFGAAGLKAEPLPSDKVAITGTVDADFVDKTVFADRFVSDGSFSLVLESVGALIAGAFSDTFRITLPACHLDDTQTLDGPGIVTGTFPFTCLFDGTNLPKIEIISADTTL